MLESRVAKAPRPHAGAQCNQDDVTHPAESELSMYGEHNAELTRTEPIKCQPSATGGTEQAVAQGEYGVEPDAAEMPGNDQQVVRSCNQ